MAWLFQDRLAYVGERMKLSNSETIQYNRPGQTAINIVMSPILTPAEEMGDLGIVRVEYQDWAFDTSSLNFGAGQVLPMPGDYVVRVSTTERFNLISMGPNKTMYRFTTSRRRRIRIRTQRANLPV